MLAPAADPIDASSVQANRPDLLFVSNDASETGAPQSLLTFVKWLVSTRVAEPTVVLAGPGPLEPAFEELCPVYRTWRGNAPLLAPALEMLRGLSWKAYRSASIAALGCSRISSRASLIYANTITTGPEVAALTRRHVPLITHVRELDSVIGAIANTPGFQANLQRTGWFIANSQATKANLVRRYGVPPERVDVVYPFVDGPIPRKHTNFRVASRIREELGLQPRRRLVLGCGTLHRRKGTDLFIEVADALVSLGRAENVSFVWVGGDTTQLTRAEMQKRAADRGLSDIVSFVGHRSDYLDFLEAADLLLLTSREEPFGRVILEAGRCATPSICFADSGGAPEFVRDDAGRVVPRADVRSMAAAAAALLDSDELRRSLGERARNRVLHEHTVEVGAPRIWDVVRRAIEPGNASDAMPARV